MCHALPAGLLEARAVLLGLVLRPLRGLLRRVRLLLGPLLRQPGLLLLQRGLLRTLRDLVLLRRSVTAGAAALGATRCRLARDRLLRLLRQIYGRTRGGLRPAAAKRETPSRNRISYDAKGRKHVHLHTSSMDTKDKIQLAAINTITIPTKSHVL